MYTKAVGLRKNGSSCWQGYLPTYWPCCGGSMCYPFYVRTATAAAGKMHLCNNYLPLFAASHSGCISPPFVCTQFSHFLQFGAFLLGLQQQQQKLRWVAPGTNLIYSESFPCAPRECLQVFVGFPVLGCGLRDFRVFRLAEQAARRCDSN